MPKNDIVYVMDNQKKRASGTIISGGGGGGSTGGGGGVDASAFLRRDGTSSMLGNLDMGGYNITNVALVDGIDVPAHVGNPDAHHIRIHDLDSVDHSGFLPWDRLNFATSDLFDIVSRPHAALTAIGPNDHHNQVHAITGSDHTAVGALALDVLGIPTTNGVLGFMTPSNNPGAAIKLLRTDAFGEITIKRLNGTDYVKSAGYVQAATSVQAGSFVSAVTYVDTPLVQQAGNVSINSGINIYLNPTGYVAVALSKSIRTDSFVSGFAGSGWQIDQNISAPGTNAEFDNLTIRGRMRVYELIIQQIRATNGSFFVSSVAKIKTVALISGDTYEFTSEDYHGFLVNDLIRAQRFTNAGSSASIYRSDFRVTSIDATTPLYKFRAIRENGGNTPVAGMDFVRIGNTTDTTRQGALYLSSDDSNAPFIDIVNGVNSWTAWTGAAKTKVRIGKITGVTSVANEYGIIASNTGFGAVDSYFKASNLGIALNNVPLQFFSGTNLSPNQTGYWSPTGNSFWIGPNTTDKRIEWNGTTGVLTVKGEITIVGSGGNAATTTSVANAQTTAINYTNTYAPSKDLLNATSPWARGETLNGNAYDTARVNGVSALTVQQGAGRANAGLNSSGQVVLPVQSPLISAGVAPATGLNLTSQYLGYYNGTSFTNFIKNDGTFRFGSALTGNRIEWNGTQLAGYNAVGSLQWYASASDGLLYAGAGQVLIGSFGVMAANTTLLDGSGFTNFRQSIVYTYTAEPNGPLDTGTYPAAYNSIDLKDTSFSATDWYGNTYSYAGQSLLRIYSSSKHFVSDDTPFDSDRWYHYLDGIVEVPPLTGPNRTILVPNGKLPPYDMQGQYVQDVYTPRLFLRNVYSSIVLYGDQALEINAQNIYFKLYSNNYTAPAQQAYLYLRLLTNEQRFISQHDFALQAGNDYGAPGNKKLSLYASNVDIGNAGAAGTLAMYGVVEVRQWFRLKAWINNGVYLEMFARNASPNTRSMWMGFGDASTTQLSIVNELGSVIYLHATDKVILANSLQVGGAIHFIRQSVTPGALGTIVQMYQGGDGHMYFRGPNGYARITGVTVISGSYP